MKQQDILTHFYDMVRNMTFDAPYGVLTSSGVSTNGKPYQRITFGRARTLDANIDIYNKNFILVNTSRHGRQVFRSVSSVEDFVRTL